MAVTSYCTVEDVQVYFSNTVFGANSPISSSKVSSLITSTSALVNTSLQGVYELPITNENDLAALKGIVSKYVAGEIDDIQNPVSPEGVSKQRKLKQEALKDLNDLIEKKRMLNQDESSISIFEKDTP